MKYLDERIIFTISGQTLTANTSGMYAYYLKRYITSATTENVFVGNFYYNGVDTAITFDLTDIISSDGFIVNEDDFPITYVTDLQRKTVKNKIVNKYFIRIDWGNNTYINSSDEWVAKIYRYNNKSMGEYRCFFEPNAYNTNEIRILEQGFTYSQTEDSTFIPHYPMINDEQGQQENDCPFGLSFLVGNNISAVTASFRIGENGEDYRTDFTIPASGNSFSFLTRAGWVGAYRDIVPTTDGYLYAMRDGTQEEYKAAIFDVCPKRYYLFWQDRFGSFQCQPFNNFANYSENFDRTDIQDYQNRQRYRNIQVQSKWKLYSGWIKEDLFPYYESIYTSPILTLYDNELNKKFTVLISGNYEEKTYRNQKKMINLNLELTENKKQNIIY